jgi:hypothetical protein
MHEWDVVEYSTNQYPNLSRSSTLVSEQGDLDHSRGDFRLEEGRAAVFQASFREKFSRHYTFEKSGFEDVKLETVDVQEVKPVSFAHGFLSRAIINGWACK